MGNLRRYLLHSLDIGCQVVDLLAVLVRDNRSGRSSGISAQDHAILEHDTGNGCTGLGGLRGLETILQHQRIPAGEPDKQLGSGMIEVMFMTKQILRVYSPSTLFTRLTCGNSQS